MKYLALICMTCLLLSYSGTAFGEDRGLYVHLEDIVGNEDAENDLLQYTEERNINCFLVYGLKDILPQRSDKLAAFIAKARTRGIETVTAIGETAKSFERVETYHQTYSVPSERFDVYNLEFEYWIDRMVVPGGYYCETYLKETRFKLTEQSLENLRNENIPDEILQNLTLLKDQVFISEDEFLDAVEQQIGQEQTDEYKELILKYAVEENTSNCNRVGAFAFYLEQLEKIREFTDASSSPILVEAYIDWPTQEEAVQIDALTDSVLLDAYKPDPYSTFGYTEERLRYFASNNQKTDISIIFSSKPEHMQAWLEDNCMTLAEQIYRDDYNAASGTWKKYINLVGFTYFKYSCALGVTLECSVLPPISYDIYDNYIGGGSEKDVAGGKCYNIDGMDVHMGNYLMGVKIHTDYDPVLHGFDYGDLFISVDGWNPYGEAPYYDDTHDNGETWEYVFDVSERNLYNISNTQDQILLSGDLGYEYRPDQEVLIDPKDLTPFSTGGVARRDDEYYMMAFFFPHELLVDYHRGNLSFGFHWTMTCANDVIEGQIGPIPEPSTLLLLGSGLIGTLALLRKRLRG